MPWIMQLSGENMGFYSQKSLSTNRIPYIVDNVVDTGNTAKAAARALGCGIVISFAMSDTLLEVQDFSRSFIR